jgi:hypothetical protein
MVNRKQSNQEMKINVVAVELGFGRCDLPGYFPVRIRASFDFSVRNDSISNIYVNNIE